MHKFDYIHRARFVLFLFVLLAACLLGVSIVVELATNTNNLLLGRWFGAIKPALACAINKQTLG